MNITRKQTKVLLDIMKIDREALQCGAITKHEDKLYFTVTDGYRLAMLRIETDEANIGKVARREDIEKWYKLAGGRDRLDDETINDMLQETDTPYPEVAKLIQNSPTPSEIVAINGRYMHDFGILADYEALHYTLHVKNGYRQYRADHEDNIYIIMGLKV